MKREKAKNINPELTKREIQVIRCLCNDETHEKIAKRLGLTVNTIIYHRKNIYKKTKTSGLASLTKYSLEKGILDGMDNELNSELTNREIQILKGICNDLSSQEIAHKLNLSVYTVNFHRVNIHKKTKAKGNFGLLKYALSRGIIRISFV